MDIKKILEEKTINEKICKLRRRTFVRASLPNVVSTAPIIDLIGIRSSKVLFDTAMWYASMSEYYYELEKVSGVWSEYALSCMKSAITLIAEL